MIMHRILRGFCCALQIVVLTGVSGYAFAGTLLGGISDYLTGRFPVATAGLALYDASGTLIDSQTMDAAGLLTAGVVNNGSSLLFNGSLTFTDPYPLTAGTTGGFTVTVHDFSVDLANAQNSAYSDLVTMQLDWLYQNESFSDIWTLTIADDFVNGIAHYSYGGTSPVPLAYGSASFSLAFATGVQSVPLPATVWLFGTGLVALVGVARRNRSG